MKNKIMKIAASGLVAISVATVAFAQMPNKNKDTNDVN